MLTLRHIAMRCPRCEHPFHSQTLTRGRPVNSKHTDFRSHDLCAEPLAYRLCACPSCGFCCPGREFMAAEQGSMTLLRNRIPPQSIRCAAERDKTASEQYEAAAKVAEAEEAAPVVVADLLLHAAWCCVDEGDVEAERFFRREAARKFQEALASYDVAMHDRAVVTYLVGELWRRIGDTRRARQWFDQVESEITDPGTQRWILEVALQQRDAPKEWFGPR